MTDHILICPFDTTLLAKLKRRKVVVHTEDQDTLTAISREAGKTNDLYAIKLVISNPLSSIIFREEWQSLPLALYAAEFGEYKELLPQLERIRKSNARFFLSSQHDFNYTGLRILSSLSIPCGIFFNGGTINWDLLNDLMHYAIYGRIKHASVEPFNWLAEHYEPAGYTDFNTVYFNHPERFIHINRYEQMAFSAQDLSAGNFIGEGLENLAAICEKAKSEDHLSFRYDIMLQMNECAYCPAFRICLAEFGAQENKKDTCIAFFSDLLDAADYVFSKKNNKGNRIWQ